MVIYVGEGINGVYNTPYFDATMKKNYSVQVLFFLDFYFMGFGSKTFHWENTTKKALKLLLKIFCNLFMFCTVMQYFSDKN